MTNNELIGYNVRRDFAPNHVSQPTRPSALVIDPDRQTARQCQQCLSRVGFRVGRPFPALANALDAWADGAPTLIVLDADLVETAGATAFWDRVSDHAVPVIYVAESPDRVAIERMALRHAAAVVVRPVVDAQLEATALLLGDQGRSGSGLARRGRASAVAPARTPEQKLRAIAALLADSADAAEPEGAALLSVREREVVDLLAEGARVVTIARTLALSPHTVRNHLKAVFRKLNVRGQQELFDYWRGPGR